jgi:hypothetical protein
MKESYWGYWLIVLGIFVVVILLLIRNVTSNNTEDYYTLNQISEAAMVDAVDFAYYRQFGELKINKEKFMENFLERLADTSSPSANYEVTFVEVYEAPPKVSVQIVSKTDKINIAKDSDSFDMTNRVDAILEVNS